MTGKTHLAFGTAIGIVCASHYFLYDNGTLPNSLLFLGAAMIGSLFPDLDSPKSIINQKNPTRNIINKLFGHRGFIHSPIFIILLSFLLFFLTNKANITDIWVYGLAIGFISHIFLDMFNKAGIPLLYPLSKHHFHCGRIRTGSKKEIPFVFIIFFVLLIIYLIWLNQTFSTHAANLFESCVYKNSYYNF